MRATALILVACAGLPAQAATIAVTTTVDVDVIDGNCSLREALRAAQSDTAVDACVAGAGDDTVEVPAGTFAIASAVAVTMA